MVISDIDEFGKHKNKSLNRVIKRFFQKYYF